MAKIVALAVVFAAFYSVEASSAYNVSFENILQSRDDVSIKIVGGTEARTNEFPYQLLVLIKTRRGTGQCGGSIVNSEWALCAAHCLDPVPPAGNVRIQAGVTDRNRKTGGEYEVTGSRIVRHPQYNSNTQANDIALIKISGTFRNSTGIKPIPLVAQGARPTGNAIATGWGTTRENGQVSSVLRKVTLPILPDSDCQKVYRSYDANKMMCAGVLAGGKDTCQGDSGGPLALNGVQVGVVSYGAGCARKNYPGVYARVSNYRNWIDSVVK